MRASPPASSAHDGVATRRTFGFGRPLVEAVRLIMVALFASAGWEVAASTGPVIPSLTDWEFTKHRQLRVPTLPRNHWLTLADLVKTNGEIALVVKANGQPIKTYKTRVSGGQIQRLPRNALDVAPHSTFISPRFIDTSERSSSRYKMFDMYWVRKQ